jgi:hypothetical protein
MVGLFNQYSDPSLLVSGTYDQQILNFASGKYAFVTQGSWIGVTMTTNDKEQYEAAGSFKVGMLPYAFEEGQDTILTNSPSWWAVFDGTNADAAKAFLQWCAEDKGFQIDAEAVDNGYFGYNPQGYSLCLQYQEDQEKLHISLDVPIPMEPIDLPDYAVAAGLPVPESQIGHIEWQKETGFCVFIGNTPKDEYLLYKDACIDAGFTQGVYEDGVIYTAANADGYRLAIRYEGFDTFLIQLNKPSANTSVNSTDK